jgi:hypothetical protein
MVLNSALYVHKNFAGSDDYDNALLSARNLFLSATLVNMLQLSINMIAGKDNRPASQNKTSGKPNKNESHARQDICFTNYNLKRILNSFGILHSPSTPFFQNAVIPCSFDIEMVKHCECYLFLCFLVLMLFYLLPRGAIEISTMRSQIAKTENPVFQL